MPGLTLECPHCHEDHSQAIGMNDDFVVTPIGRTFTCPFCKKEFMLKTLLSETEETARLAVDSLFEGIVRSSPIEGDGFAEGGHARDCDCHECSPCALNG